MAYPDIKVGIPSLLLAIEMTIFAIIHIFAFSWKPYDITKNADPSLHYQGGKFGWYALWDAFNLWDVVKAAARGFRWLFHGRKFREHDASYEQSRRKVGEDIDTRYGGGYAVAGEQEMGVMRSDDERRWKPTPPPMHRTRSNEDDDHQGLLNNAQSNPMAPMR